jgi:soluble lytic murein transglycosylase-like protein
MVASLFIQKEDAPKPYEIAIRGYSVQNGLSPEVVAAVILQESGGNPFAFRYEDGFFKRYIDNKLPASLGGPWHKGISFESETRMRAVSYGLVQVMGQTARESGFEGYLPELFHPDTNIKLGCIILGKLLKYYQGNYKKALSAYNAGKGWVDRNGATAYADKVLARVESNEIKKVITV